MWSERGEVVSDVENMQRWEIETNLRGCSLRSDGRSNHSGRLQTVVCDMGRRSIAGVRDRWACERQQEKNDSPVEVAVHPHPW